MIVAMNKPFTGRVGRVLIGFGAVMACGLACCAAPEPTTASPGLAAVAPSPTWESRAKAFGGYEWVTRPSRDAVMGFTLPVDVQEIAVVGGQKVKKGQLLIRGRDGEATANVAVQQVRANNNAGVKNAEAALELAKLRFDDGKRAREEGALTAAEFDERRVAVLSAEAALDNAKSQAQEERERLIQLQKQAERYRLEAPFDGEVELVACEVGQAVDVQASIIRIVATDPMWVDVPTPADESMRVVLQNGQRAWVLLDVPSEGESQAPVIVEGKVLYVSPVVDASGSRRARVELPNAKGWPAGTRARVRFTEPGALGVAGK